MSRNEADFLPGTLDLLILKTLAMGPTHGWGVSKRIRQISRDVLDVNQGSLYPALHRLEQRGLVEAEWGTAGDSNRRVKVYSLTTQGGESLADQLRAWKSFALAVDRILETA